MFAAQIRTGILSSMSVVVKDIDSSGDKLLWVYKSFCYKGLLLYNLLIWKSTKSNYIVVRDHSKLHSLNNKTTFAFLSSF